MSSPPRPPRSGSASGSRESVVRPSLTHMCSVASAAGAGPHSESQSRPQSRSPCPNVVLPLVPLPPARSPPSYTRAPLRCAARRADGCRLARAPLRLGRRPQGPARRWCCCRQRARRQVGAVGRLKTLVPLVPLPPASSPPARSPPSCRWCRWCRCRSSIPLLPLSPSIWPSIWALLPLSMVLVPVAETRRASAT